MVQACYVIRHVCEGGALIEGAVSNRGGGVGDGDGGDGDEREGDGDDMPEAMVLVVEWSYFSLPTFRDKKMA